MLAGGLLQRLGMEALEGFCRWIDDDAGVFQSDDSEARLNVFRAEDDLRDRLQTHECDAREAVIILDRLAVSQFIHGFSLRLDARRSQLVCWSKAIDGAG